MEYRGYMIVSDGTYGYREIKPKGRGSVPVHLRGIWVTVRDAQRAIDMMVDRKEVANGEGNISV